MKNNRMKILQILIYCNNNTLRMSNKFKNLKKLDKNLYQLSYKELIKEKGLV